jgi:hypothetical protein
MKPTPALPSLALLLLAAGLSACDKAPATQPATLAPPQAIPKTAPTPSVTPMTKSTPAIEYIGKAAIPGNATDQSGLKEIIAESTPHNLLGAFGSAIDYTGKNDLYIGVNDRGPFDGKSAFQDRYHLFKIAIKPGAPTPVIVECVKTVLLTNESGQNLIGTTSAFDATNSDKGLRYDPEGLRILPDGNLLISDEYGPFIHIFSPDGKRIKSLAIPENFKITTPDPDKKTETKLNKKGRATNKGLEGLALNPAATKAYAILQAPLIQDNPKSGKFVRMLEIDLVTGATRQLAVQRPSKDVEYNEVLAMDDHRFLLIERDDTAGLQAKYKKIVQIDITGASDVSAIDSLDNTTLPDGFKPVATRPFLDLLDPAYGLRNDKFPEKIEGLTFGPNLPDGRRTLLVSSDNDMDPSEPTFIWVFAVKP